MLEIEQRTTKQLEHQPNEAVPKPRMTKVIVKGLKWVGSKCLWALIWALKRPATWRFIMVRIPAWLDDLQKLFDQLLG